ncbi:hypothetical protein [Vibrio sp. Of7-15]|nr:hypothetical protein [Vibrio sp. Of7-15]
MAKHRNPAYTEEFRKEASIRLYTGITNVASSVFLPPVIVHMLS